MRPRGLLLLALLVGGLVPAAAAMPARAAHPVARVSLARGWMHAPLRAPGLQVDKFTGNLGFEQIVRGGPGLMALECCPHPHLWSSADGTTWRRVPLGSPAFRPGERFFRLFAAGAFLVLLGQAPGNGQLRVWTSKDGLHWQRVDAAPSIFGEPPHLFSAGGRGLLGFTEPFDPSGYRTVVYTSADGRHWQRIPDRRSVFAGASIQSVVQGGPGYVAGGAVLNGGHRHAAVWISRDGLEWRRVPREQETFGGPFSNTEIFQVVAGLRRLLALGSKEDAGRPGPLAWTSSDGVQWKEAATPPFNVGADGQVLAWGSGFVGITRYGGGTVLWSSNDGRSWSRVGSDEIFGGTANIADLIDFHSTLEAPGALGLRPRPSCQSGFGHGPAQTFRPTTFLWSPQRSRSALAGSRDALDPKRLLLSPAELSRQLGPNPDVRGEYDNLCPFAPTLGPHVAYRYDSNTNVRFTGIGIAVQSAATARAVLAHVAPALFRPLAGCGETISAWQGLPLSYRIGDGTKVFTVTISGAGCEQLLRSGVTARVRRLRASTSSVHAGIQLQLTVVVWRLRRFIGEVAVLGDQRLAMQLARKQWGHIKGGAP